MYEIAAISGALTSIRAVLDLLKNATDGALAIKISTEIANVQSKLIEVQQQALDLQESNQQLRAELDKYKSVVQHHSVLWRKRDDGSEDGPFGPVCAGEGREMRLILRQSASQDGFESTCEGSPSFLPCWMDSNMSLSRNFSPKSTRPEEVSAYFAESGEFTLFVE